MTKEQAIAANKEKGVAIKDLMKKYSKEEFKERHVGHYSGHVRKLKKVFNSTSFGLRNHNQPDAIVVRLVFAAPVR